MLDAVTLAVCFCQVGIDALAALHQGFGEPGAVSVAVGCLADQPKVAVSDFKELPGWEMFDTFYGVLDRPGSGSAPPRLDDMANEIHAALDGLQDGFAGVELHGELADKEAVDGWPRPE